ncbi:MAG: hypothetical protein S4CHLAM20_14890 [Chlamydiia bacterium]|nr:hypothetical protein [Chlamydiia bacterium]
MQLFLSYAGVTSTTGHVAKKFIYRRYFRPQLKELQRHLIERDCPSCFNFNDENVKTVGEFSFLPLVTNQCNKVIDFNFTFLSHFEPANGLRFPTGDTDNHLKALLDGLRMPNTKNEIREEKPKKGEKIFHCLMEDDGIVRKINIEHQKLLFDMPKTKRDDKEVFVLIEANILPKYE